MHPRGELLPIRQAAKALRKSRAFVRELIEGGEVTAYRSGGKDDAPRLRVYLEEVKEAVERRTIYVPASLKKSGAKRPSSKGMNTLHPAAMGMRTRHAKHE